MPAGDQSRVSHAGAQDDSQKLPPFYSPRTTTADNGDTTPQNIEELNIGSSTPSSRPIESSLGELPPPSLLSPAFTPPATPGSNTPRSAAAAGPRGVPVDSSVPSGGCGNKKPKLLETLPEVECLVRARIPTVAGTEMFLHLYTNNVDNKEHLAIVFGNNIRSKSLDAPREGETEMDRMIRGAYTGRLYPGRTSSNVEQAQSDAGADSSEPPLVRIHSECY
ncbi:unnamed protein product, partial [Clonostachys rosea]